MKENRIKKLAVTILSVMTLASAGTAAAAYYSYAVGGGYWSVSYTSGIHVTSQYYHGSVKHSASAQVGNGTLIRDVQPAGITARASAYGIGTTHAWWNNEIYY